MRSIKSERLKKLESELADLQQWLNLGLVPKKDVSKHKAEIKVLQERIEEELERLAFLKESGDLEEYITPKRGNQRTAYTDLPSLPDMDASESNATQQQGESGFDMATDTPDNSNSIISEQDDTETSETPVKASKNRNDDNDDMEDDESFFSSRSRWRRDGILDPDSDDW